ncbi:MAG: sigma-70 family RNA polymerase sigma factor, partial [Planctomycetota bacterium]
MIDSETALDPVIDGDEDWQLLQRIAIGDRAAGDQLFARYVDMAFRVAVRLVGSSSDAEDVVQNAFLGVMAQAGRYRGINSAKAWIMRIVVNHARMHLRGEGRRRLRQQKAWEQHSFEDGEDRTDEAVLEQVRLMVDDLLPEHERLPLWMHYREGLNLKEVAQALGRRESTVRTQVARGIGRLRSAMQSRGFTVAAGTGLAGLLVELPAAQAPQSLQAVARAAAAEGPLATAGGTLLGAWSAKLALAGIGLLAAGGITYLALRRDPPRPAPLPPIPAARAPAPADGLLATPIRLELAHASLPGALQAINRALPPDERLRFAYSNAWRAEAPWSGVDLAADTYPLHAVVERLATAYELEWQLHDGVLSFYRPLPAQRRAQAIATLGDAAATRSAREAALAELARSEDPAALRAVISAVMLDDGSQLLDRVLPAVQPRWPLAGASDDSAAHHPAPRAVESPALALRGDADLARTLSAVLAQREGWLKPYELEWVGALGIDTLTPRLAAELERALATAGGDAGQIGREWRGMPPLAAVAACARALARIGGPETEQVLLDAVAQCNERSSGTVFPQHFAPALARHGGQRALQVLFGWLRRPGRWYMIDKLQQVGPGRLALVPRHLLAVLQAGIEQGLGPGQCEQLALLTGLIAWAAGSEEERALEQMLVADNDEARFLAAAALAPRGHAQARAALVEVLAITGAPDAAPKHHFYRRSAAHILAALGEPGDLAALFAARLPQSASAEERTQRLETIAASRSPAAALHLAQQLEAARAQPDPDPGVAAIVAALARTRVPQAGALLEDLAHNAPEAPLRAEARAALAATDHPAAGALLRQAAREDPDVDNRAKAVRLLAQRTDPASVPVLRELVWQDAEPAVRA